MKKSNYHELEAQRIKEIIRSARSNPRRDHIPWFYRGEILGLLALALEHKQDRLILDGKEFVVIYKDTTATVRPADGTFSPCAHIIIKKYLGEWDAYERATRITRLADQK
jgi:hypothetical protein